MAKSTRAYTLVANFSGSDHLGSNALLALNLADRGRRIDPTPGGLIG
jgi:hypothetical protein